MAPKTKRLDSADEKRRGKRKLLEVLHQLEDLIKELEEELEQRDRSEKP